MVAFLGRQCLHYDCNSCSLAKLGIWDAERPHIRNIHGLEVTLVVGLPALGITNIAVVSSAMVDTVLEDGAGQGSGAGEN